MTNPVSGGFQFTPATGLNDTATYPSTPISEAAARQQFMDIYWQLMNEMNTPTLSAASFALYNKLINGNFDVWQRGTTVTNPTNFAYLADRFFTSYANIGTLPTNIVHSRQILTSGDIPNAFYHYRIATDGAGSGFGANDAYGIYQRIENGTRNLCGLGKKVTLSFWARSSIAGKKLALFTRQRYGTGGSPSVSEEVSGGISITLTSTWTKYTVTFTTNTLAGKTFGTNNDDYLQIALLVMWGTGNSALFTGGGTLETFGGAGNIDIAQVQVNAGDTALPFQPRSFAEELALCLRYYEKSYDVNTVPGTNVDNGVVIGQASNGVAASTAGSLITPCGDTFKVQKRVIPTVVLYSRLGTKNAILLAGSTDRTGATAGTPSTIKPLVLVSLDATSSAVITDRLQIQYHWTADAEI